MKADLRALGVAVGVTFAGWSTARADVLDVGPFETYQTIQAAIDAATHGDTIKVQDGVYAEWLRIGSLEIRIESVNGSDSVTIESPMVALNDMNLVQVDVAADVTLDGVTLDGLGRARTLQVKGGSLLDLNQVVVQGGVCLDDAPGGGLSVDGTSSAVISNTWFSGGLCDSGLLPWGGNIAVKSGGTALLWGGNDIENGLSERGGGIWVDGSGWLVVDDSSFVGNAVGGALGDYDGGGIYAASGALVQVSGSTFTNNVAGADDQSDGGAFFTASTVSLVDDCVFDANTAGAGGAIATRNGSVEVVDSVLQSNSAGSGGGVSCFDALQCDVHDSHFEGNTAAVGGAIYQNHSTGWVTGNTLCFNQAWPAGVGMYGDGGAVVQDHGDLTVVNNVFFENTADDQGGAVRVADGAYDSINNHYVGNRSTADGAAMWVEPVAGLFTYVDSENDLFGWNLAGASGGALDIGYSVATVGYGWFWANTPGNGSVSFGATNVLDLQAPLLNGYVSGNCDPFLMRPRAGSPLIDAGQPMVLDPDGSVSDIGAFGGAMADGDLFADLDFDGLIGLWDCDDADQAVMGPDTFWIDMDGDGLGGAVSVLACEIGPNLTTVPGDCDDLDALIGLPQIWYADDDGDGFGASGLGSELAACEPPAGFVDNDDDCDDTDRLLNPATVWLLDMDGDGFGQDNVVVGVGCMAPPDGAIPGGDCDDLDPLVNPDTVWWWDEDGDGFGSDAAVLACDPGPNFVDNPDDCDDSDPYIGLPIPWYMDEDGDGWGSDEQIEACEPPPKTAAMAGDCDSANPQIHPGADEWCDDTDWDCDGVTQDPDAVDALTFFSDRDGDGFGASTDTQTACALGPGLTLDDTDCDDGDPAIFPGAVETWYDGIDQDCDAHSDYDQDFDGYDSLTAVGGTDCNDLNPEVNPGVIDAIDDGLDQDCDGLSASSWVVGGGGGCGCSTGGSGWSVWGLAAALFVRRRKMLLTR